MDRNEAKRIIMVMAKKGKNEKLIREEMKKQSLSGI